MNDEWKILSNGSNMHELEASSQTVLISVIGDIQITQDYRVQRIQKR